MSADRWVADGVEVQHTAAQDIAGWHCLTTLPACPAGGSRTDASFVHRQALEHARDHGHQVVMYREVALMTPERATFDAAIARIAGLA